MNFGFGTYIITQYELQTRGTNPPHVVNVITDESTTVSAFRNIVLDGSPGIYKAVNKSSMAANSKRFGGLEDICYLYLSFTFI